MKSVILISGLLSIVFLLTGCAAAKPTAPASAPAAVPPAPVLETPAKPAPSATAGPVTLDNVCAHTGETVTLEGILRLPEAVTCSVGLSPNWCSASLYDPFTAKSIRVDLYVSGGPDADPDRMAALPRPYASPDFKVGTYGGGLAGHGSPVGLSGKIASARSGDAGGEVACKLSEVQNVSALQQLTPPGVEVQPVNLADAAAAGWVDASAQGKGMDRIDLRLKSQVDYPLEVIIQAGTIFEPLSSEVQNMVVRQGSLAVLRPQAEVTVEVDVACASMQKKEPGRGDAFKVAAALAGEDLQKLFALPELRFVAARVQQFAVWTITDNPARGYYVGVSTARGISEGPTGEELAQVKELFATAGIDAGKFEALR